MLSKVVYSNVEFGTDEVKNYSKYNIFDIVMDNQNGLLLVKKNKEVYIWNYKNNKKYNYNKIKLEFNNEIFIKQIDSFDQNNIKESKNIRKSVLEYFKFFEKSGNLLGIGGEYYLYFRFLKYKSYFGLSNHKSIVEDANINFPKSDNVLVNYDDGKSLPKLDTDTYDVIINVVNIHENIIKYISKYNCKNIIIITCKPLQTKIKMLQKYLTLIKISHVKNINSLITICLFRKNNFNYKF